MNRDPNAPVRLLGAPRRSNEQGYILLVALLIMAVLAVLGSSTLQVAGIDHRIAVQNRKHMMTLNTSHAGTEHARASLMFEDPPVEGLDSGPDTYGDFVTATEAETDFGGIAYASNGGGRSSHNLGVYWVSATFHRCGNPPPGYSTELGQNKFRADYWEMESTARMQSSTSSGAVNETTATTSMMVRKVKFGTCKIR